MLTTRACKVGVLMGTLIYNGECVAATQTQTHTHRCRSST